MVNQRLSRRLNRLFTSKAFLSFVFLLLLSLIVYLAFFTNLIKKETPIVTNESDLNFNLNLKFISFTPSEATSTATIVKTEIESLKGSPFQINSVNENGDLSNIISENQNNYVTVLVNQNVPSQTDLQNLYAFWSILNRQEPDFKEIYLTGNHIGVILGNLTLCLFKTDTSPTDDLNTLQQIRLQSTMNLDGVLIDLRFDKPVITQNIR